jgi:hypothetical protein
MFRFCPLMWEIWTFRYFGPFPIQLKTHIFLAATGRTISGQLEELSKTGDWPGYWTKLPQEKEGIALKVRQTTLRKHKTRTLPVAERPQNGWAFYRWP